jgi:ComF family protein
MEFKTIAHSVFDLFFPQRCVSCDSVIPASGFLCVSCASKLPYTHWKLDDENFAFEKVSQLCTIHSAYSLLAFQHENVTQKLLHALKYNNQPKIGKSLAEKTLTEIELKNFDGIIPVPVHPKKLKKRGYNQVMSFAEKFAEESKIPLFKDLLIRIENNPSQVHKNREQRLNSIGNAFSCTKENLSGNYILIDDVITTGATLSTCVKTIQAKNLNVKISIVTMACAM